MRRFSFSRLAWLGLLAVNQELRTRRIAMLALTVALITLTIGSAFSLKGWGTLPADTAAAPASMPSLRGQAATDYLKQQGLYDSVNEAIRAARYSVGWAAHAPLPGGGGAHEAVNAAQELRAYFTPRGVEVRAGACASSSSSSGSWQMGLHLRAAGRPQDLREVGQAEVSASGKRASLRRQIVTDETATDLEEWYENREDGLEQGFTWRPDRRARARKCGWNWN